MPNKSARNDVEQMVRWGGWAESFDGVEVAGAGRQTPVSNARTADWLLAAGMDSGWRGADALIGRERTHG